MVERAGSELTGDWVVSERLPLSERLAANFARTATHAMAPSDAWRIYRRARAADQPELDEIVARHVETVISSVSLNHLGTRTPPPLLHLALTGFVAFAETTLDEARVRKAPRGEVMRLLTDTLLATIQAACAGSIEGDRRPTDTEGDLRLPT